MILVGNVLKHTKGDTGSITIKKILLGDGSEYTLQSGDTLTLTVRAIPKTSSTALIQVTSNTNTLTIQPADTADVPVGKYSADIQLTTAGGEIYTIWPNKEQFSDNVQTRGINFENFWIWPEVT